MPRRRELLAAQMLKQLAPFLIIGCKLWPGGMIGCRGHIPYGPALPSVHNIDRGEFLLIKTDVECTGDFTGVLHAECN